MDDIIESVFTKEKLTKLAKDIEVKTYLRKELQNERVDYYP